MDGEEEDPSNPNQTLYQPPAAAAAHPKHAAMLERLANRKQQQQQQSHPHQSDSTQSFLSLFSQSKVSIDCHISRLRRQSTDQSNPTLKSDLDKISISISDLEKLVAQNSYSLPSFEVRTCLETISSLKQTLDTLASDLVPKKRFSFKSKKAPSSDRTVIESETRVTASENPSFGVRESLGFEDREKKDPSSDIVNAFESETPKTESEQRSLLVRDSPGFKERENEVLVREFKEASGMGEFSISDLSSCEVQLTGCLRALFVHKLRDCKVYVGPVFGSVLIEEVEGCVFVLASHQIRIHHAKESDFYLRVRSRPIIEDCSGVRFAPYCLEYYGIERDLKESNLDEETGNWANVDDFRWLKAVQSPNWSILPESERIGRVTIVNSDK